MSDIIDFEDEKINRDLRGRAGILGYLYPRSREFISSDSTPAEYRSLITIRDLES